MKILGIDPGPGNTAMVLWDSDDEKILFKQILPSDTVEAVIKYLWDQYHMDLVAIEHLACYGMAVGAEVFETAYWIGEYRKICRDLSISMLPIMRSAVKMHHCKSSRATDANIHQVLLDRFGLLVNGKRTKGTKNNPGLLFGIKDDMWSALAIAVLVGDLERKVELT